jgi:hypothetical protein
MRFSRYLFILPVVFASVGGGCSFVSSVRDRALFVVAPDNILAICLQADRHMQSVLRTEEICTLAGLIESRDTMVEDPVLLCQATYVECLRRSKGIQPDLSLCSSDIVRRARSCSETDTVMAQCLRQKVEAISVRKDWLSCEHAGNGGQLSTLIEILLGFPDTKACILVREECPQLFPFNLPQSSSSETRLSSSTPG